MKKFIISILIASGIIYLALSVAWIRSHGWNRPYISWGIRELANYLAEQDLSPRGCLDLVWFEIGLTQTEARAECVYTYAELTKDPSACELLMPSSYGWSCLGVAEEPNARMCWFDFGGKAQKIGDDVLPECGAREDSLSERCCTMAQQLYIERKTSCESFNDSEILHDQCLELLARREKRTDICAKIKNENVRVGCEIGVRALINRIP